MVLAWRALDFRFTHPRQARVTPVLKTQPYLKRDTFFMSQDTFLHREGTHFCIGTVENSVQGTQQRDTTKGHKIHHTRFLLGRDLGSCSQTRGKIVTCDACNVNLCVPCFKIFHTVDDIVGKREELKDQVEKSVMVDEST